MTDSFYRNRICEQADAQALMWRKGYVCNVEIAQLRAEKIA
jgi:hypothetical protein